ncbi:MAG: PDZ domain-containing protein [Candidatus Omnitrophica bacterium]|nr:PDZ domain-containing protein [Candidatus Omnitrophota bacterium]
MTVSRISYLVFRTSLFVLFLLSATCFKSPVFAGQLPSLFRGVVVADSPEGVRVISVEENSQAYFADLRPEDLVIQIDGTSVKTIDEFSRVSQDLKGRTIKASMVILRNGEPREVTLHLYSYPVLRQWDLTFVPEHDIRFAEAEVGAKYWMRLGRGFLEAGKPEPALNAYLNALHNDPRQLDAALQVARLLLELTQIRLKAQQLPEALAAFKQGAVVLEHLFEQPLASDQLAAIKTQLQQTLLVLKAYHQAP